MIVITISCPLLCFYKTAWFKIEGIKWKGNPEKKETMQRGGYLMTACALEIALLIKKVLFTLLTYGYFAISYKLRLTIIIKLLSSNALNGY